MKNIKIRSSIKDYELFFNLDLKKIITDLVEKYNCHFLIDKNIWNIYQLNLKKTILGKSIKIFEAKEKNKTLLEINEYIDFLLKRNIQKNDKLIVIGGGLVQDIGSFTAHIVKRGVDWVFIPTTLLSMVDSCIGAKSGINIGKFKNQIGSFHPPIEIYIINNFLDTLSKIDLINGIGEIIKHALIDGEKIFSYIEKNIKKNVDQNLIYESLLIKKKIVEKDELEKNIRRLLNYGHTFGHGIEGYTGNKIPHGQGVLIGMDLANFISFKRNLLEKDEFLRIHKILKYFIGINKIPIKDVDLYIKFLKTDKKVIGDEVDAILCRGIGKIKIIRIKFDKELKKNIMNYLDFFKNDKTK